VLVDPTVLPFAPGYVHHAHGLARGIRWLPLGFWPVLASDAYRAGPITLARAARQVLAGDLRAKLSTIQAPTLVVWGEHDTIVPPTLGTQLLEHLPQARLVVVPGSGHNPMWDAAAVFNQTVREFLTEAVPADSTAERDPPGPAVSQADAPAQRPHAEH
jgi:pimeloyl-ACP methyl ester carboxylesterase